MTNLGTHHYCIVRCDENGRCDDPEFVALEASTKEDPAAKGARCRTGEHCPAV